MPSRPTAVADQRRSRITSPRKITASTLVKIGAVKLSAVAWASGIKRQGREPADHADDADRGAQRVQAQALGAQRADAVAREPGQHRDQAEDVAKEHHLKRIEGRGQMADQDDHHRERGRCGDHPERGADRRRQAGDRSRTI